MTEKLARSKVLHLITRLDFGGSSENVVFSARGSIKAGREVLIASGPASTLTEAVGNAKVSCVVLPDLVRSINPWRDMKAFFQIIQLLRDWKPDIVHTHSSKAGILGRWAAWFYRRFFLPAGAKPPRVIHTPHGHVFYGYFNSIKSSFFLLLERRTAKITDDLIALSEGEKRESLERRVGNLSQWTVIPSGVAIFPSNRLTRTEVSALLHVQIPDDALVIGCIARLEPVKGVDVLIEAAFRVRSDIADRKAIFLIIGEGNQKRALESRLTALGIANAVILAGYQKDPWTFLGIMDVYVQPSLNEGMGKTLVMAQAAELPVVASQVCGIPDVVRDKETGFLVQPSNPDVLATTILRLLNNEPMRKSMGQSAARWVLSKDETGHGRFSAESMAVRLERLYGN